jgi:hypothetical protein
MVKFAKIGLAANNPSLVVLVTVLVSLVAFTWSIIKDKSPDLDAVIIAVVLPSVLVSMDGKGADTLNRWLDNAWDWLANWAGPWLGTESTLVQAVAALAVAFALMKRTGGSSGTPSRIATGGHGPSKAKR